MESFDVNFLFIEKFSRSLIYNLLKRCFDVGCVTNRNGNTIEYKSLETDWHAGSINEVADNISKNNRGAISTLWYKDLDFSIFIMLESIEIGPGIPHITLSVEPVYFTEDEDKNHPFYYKKSLDKIIGLSKELYLITKPVFVGGEGNDPDDLTPKLMKDDLQRGTIKNLFWFNIFPPKLVEKLGREKLLSAPCWMVEELADGGIMLILTQHPFFSDVRNEHKKKKEEVEKYLGLR